MAKSDKFYFENFVANAVIAREAANYLLKCLENYNPKDIEEMLVQMHTIEHRADMKKHEMKAALAKAFVTPIDREDLDKLSHDLDDVTDEIEEVLQKFFMYNVTDVTPYAIEFARKIVNTCDLLCDLMTEFEHFKKSKKLKLLIIELNDIEEECDKLYLAAMRDLTKNATEIIPTIAWHEIYDCLEACVDTCEYVSESIDTIVMKNT